MSFYQKSLYWISLVANLVSVLSDPVLMSLPFMCLVLGTCIYGMDEVLFWTHLGHLVIHFFAAVYYLDLQRVLDAMKVSTSQSNQDVPASMSTFTSELSVSAVHTVA